MGVVANQADAEIGVRFKQQLAASEIAVAVVDVGIVVAVAIETVALEPYAFEPEGEGLGQRAGNSGLEPAHVEVADCCFAIGVPVECRLFRKDVDQTGRGVAPEQCALRPAQYFDVIELTQFVEPDAGARTVNPIDEHRDRAFETRIVADRADAADTGRSIGFGAGRGDQQRRCELVELANVGCAGQLHFLAADGGDRDRHVLQQLAAALGGDDDFVGLSGSVRLRLSGGRRSGGLSRAVPRIRLRRGLAKGRSCNCDERCRQQPYRLAHISLPCWSQAPAGRANPESVRKGSPIKSAR